MDPPPQPPESAAEPAEAALPEHPEPREADLPESAEEPTEVKAAPATFGEAAVAAPLPTPASPAGAVERPDERSEADRTDGECSDDTGESELPSEDPREVDGPDAEEILSLARVESLPASSTPGAASEPEQPPPVTPLDSTYTEGYLPPRTGIHVPMLADPPTFIRAVPTQPEPLYTAPETLFDEIIREEADRISRPDLVLNRTVYDSVGCLVSEGDGLVNSKLNVLKKDLLPYYMPAGPEDRTLVFESRFESGNLRRAVQVYEFQYDLYLNPDYNTTDYTQWYLFRVSNTRKGQTYRFNIVNMVKPTSVYNEGMRPLQYSNSEADANGVGWVRCGESIAYYQNGIRRRDKGGCNYHTLTFKVSFQHDFDTVYFSHCYPYSYTDLQKDLQQLELDPYMSRRFRRRKLCDTLAGNCCDLITITSFACDPAVLRARRAVVITARVHPGESNASWVMKGMLDYLTGGSLDARILRDNFVFKIIPMLNPDGVIVGNYRCSLAGQDLNRLWDSPSRRLHPTIFFAKSMFHTLLSDREVVLYIDIHGHSRKKNVFMYGNCLESHSIREKIFPALLCRSSDCFCFDDCCFKIQKSKESTARVVAYRELAVINSFTLEASFCGADFGPLADQHFTTRHLEEMGYMMCDAILDFFDPDQTKVNQVCKELQVLFPDDGASDDVSDSDVDEASLARARRRRKAQKAKREGEKPEKKGGGKKKGASESGSHREGREGGSTSQSRTASVHRRRQAEVRGRDVDEVSASPDADGVAAGALRRMSSIASTGSARGRDAAEQDFFPESGLRPPRGRRKKKKDRAAPPDGSGGATASSSTGRNTIGDRDGGEGPSAKAGVFPPLPFRRTNTDRGLQ